MSTTVQFWAEMSCGGCSGAIKRIVSKIDGVESVECSVDDNTVVVTSSAAIEPQVFLDKLAAWSDAGGKKISLTAL